MESEIAFGYSIPNITVHTDTENAAKYLACKEFFEELVGEKILYQPHYVDYGIENMRKSTKDPFGYDNIRSCAAVRAMTLMASTKIYKRSQDFIVSIQKGFHLDRTKTRGSLVCACAIIYRGVVASEQSSTISLPTDFVCDLRDVLCSKEPKSICTALLKDLYSIHFDDEVASGDKSIYDFVMNDPRESEVEWIKQGIKGAVVQFGKKSLRYSKTTQY